MPISIHGNANENGALKRIRKFNEIQTLNFRGGAIAHDLPSPALRRRRRPALRPVLRVGSERLDPHCAALQALGEEEHLRDAAGHQEV